jgi:RNA polymerase sigma factor (sigma-70 family)
VKQDNFDAFKRAKQRAFGCFLKKMLRNTSRDYFRKLDKRSRREVYMGDCTDVNHKHFHVVDKYFFDETVFNVMDYSIPISDELLAETLLNLPLIKRNIMLLSGALEMSDREVGEILGIKRSTVQYHKSNTQKQLREHLIEG